jgi:uncharacterized protein (DUF1800 family)
MAGQMTAIALNRFGIGARPSDTPPADVRDWLLDQITVARATPTGLATFADAVAVYEPFLITRQVKKFTGRTPEYELRYRADRRAIRHHYTNAVDARMQAALLTDVPLIERLVWFWANHFAVSADRPELVALVGAFETDAIRPHVLGRFGDMLAAVTRHPAMLMFLDQSASIGPNSRAGLRAAKRAKLRGLNENLAREILELHTLGVRSGYSQDDVRALASALTGWTLTGIGAVDASGVAQPTAVPAGSFEFRPDRHEPGAVNVLGRRYDQEGEEQARAILADLALAPATARHVATKLARHFAGDTPPAALVARLAAAYLETDGSLPAMYRVLIEARETWVPGSVKFKTPWEWSVSALRATGRRSLERIQALGFVRQAGQDVWRPGSPAGYPDMAANWASSSTLMARVELAAQLVSPVASQFDPRQLAAAVLPDVAGSATATGIERAESPAMGLTLLLVSPEFQRR